MSKKKAKIILFWPGNKNIVFWPAVPQIGQQITILLRDEAIDTLVVGEINILFELDDPNNPTYLVHLIPSGDDDDDDDIDCWPEHGDGQVEEGDDPLTGEATWYEHRWREQVDNDLGW